jgi:formate hydrogenlyase transcriptional activator
MSADAAAFAMSNLIPFALSEPEQLLAAYFKSSIAGLSILDSDFRYLAINPTLAEMNGVPASDHLGKPVREILGVLADKVEPRVRKVLFTGEPELNVELTGVLPTRTEAGHWIEHYFPIKDDTGTVIRVGIITVETTSQRRLEGSLQHVSERLRREMDRLQMMLDVSSLLASNRNPQESFPLISARIRRSFRHEYAGFELHDAITGLLIRHVDDFPLGKGLLSGVQINSNNSPQGRALQQQTPLIFSKEQMEGFDVDIVQRFLAEGLRTLCCVPLFRPDAPLGVIVLGSTRAEAFQPADLGLLGQIAAQVSLSLENHRAAQEIDLLKERLAGERKYLANESISDGAFSEIIGDSPALKRALDQVVIVAPSEATVLILGETGTGKELIARALHRLSRRSHGRFIKVNCAAIPTGLLESELFGHEKGAFTGAVTQKIGRMELANGGTLFLDEIGEIPLELQPKLLRVLQDHEFERLGSPRTIEVNLRLVAATNRDLAQSMADHEFRSDLFYRLNVFPIRMPSLGERREDIPLLVRHFVHKFALRMNRHIETVPTETMAALREWSWPGNIRELENLMERSVILSEGTALRVPLAELQAESPNIGTPPDHTLDNAEREHILRTLRETAGVLSGPDGAAHRLGLKRTTLQSKMQRLKITRKDYSRRRP